MALSYIAFALTTWAIFILSEAIYFQRLKKMSSINGKKSEADEVFSTTSVNHALPTASIKVNAMLQMVTAFIIGAIYIAVIFIFAWGLHSRSMVKGTLIVNSTFYFVLGYFGYTASTTGSNKRVVTFLCLSVVGLAFGCLECAQSADALNFRDELWIEYDNWGRPVGKNMYFAPLVAIHVVILVMALTHVTLSIWGIVIAARALQKDSTCARCCNNCLCCISCEGCGNCEDSCSNDVGRTAVHYQPIQFIVSHQGTTTMENGQPALVVLLPLNAAVTLPMNGAQKEAVSADLGDPINQVFV